MAVKLEFVLAKISVTYATRTVKPCSEFKNTSDNVIKMDFRARGQTGEEILLIWVAATQK